MASVKLVKENCFMRLNGFPKGSNRGKKLGHYYLETARKYVNNIFKKERKRKKGGGGGGTATC